MLTNNYKNWVNWSLRYTSIGSNTFYDLIDVDGTTHSPLAADKGNSYKALDYNFKGLTYEKTKNESGAYLFVGTGEKEESQEDIALESRIPDKDLLINTYSGVLSGNRYIFSETFTYVGTDRIAVSEVAFYKGMHSTSYGRTVLFCFARQKIEPIIVSNGDVFTVTMVIG